MHVEHRFENFFFFPFFKSRIFKGELLGLWFYDKREKLNHLGPRDEDLLVKYLLSF